MHDDVGAVLDRAQQDRRRHRVVDDQRHAARVRHVGERLDVADVAGRIADALAEHRAGVVVDQRRDVLGAVARGEARLDAVAAQDVREQRVGGAVELRRRDDVAAAVGERQRTRSASAAWPEATASAATPPSSCATRCSRMPSVGLAMRL